MAKAFGVVGKVLTAGVLVFLSPHLSADEWSPINIGGGGAMNGVVAGPSGQVIVATDLAGAYLQPSLSSQWAHIGQASGLLSTHVTQAAIHPTDENIILLLADGGIYRSANGGDSFSLANIAASANLSSQAVFHSVAFAPSNPEIVYITSTPTYNTLSGSNQPVLLRSSDAGLSFTPVPSPVDSIHGAKIIVNPFNANDVVLLSDETRFINIDDSNSLGLTKGVYRYLHNSGATPWTQIADSSLSSDPIDIAFHPLSDTVAKLYLSTQTTDDQGSINANVKLTALSGSAAPTSWETILDTTVAGQKMGFAPRLLLWPSDQNDSDMRVIDVYSSYWHYDSPETSGNHTALRIQKDALGDWAYTSLGNVIDWTIENDDSHLGWSHSAFVINETLAQTPSTLGLSAQNADTAYVVTPQFVYKLTDTGNSPLDVINITTIGNDTAGWSSTGIDNITPFILDANSIAGETILYSGMNDLGCMVSLNQGDSWKQCNPPPLGDDSDFWTDIDGESIGGTVTALASDPDQGQKLWMIAMAQDESNGTPIKFKFVYNENAAAPDLWLTKSGNIELDSQDSQALQDKLTNLEEAYGLSVDPSSLVSNRTLYLTVMGDVFKSSDGGDNWSRDFDCQNKCRVTAIDASAGLKYAGGEGGLFVADLTANNWTPISDISFAYLPTDKVFEKDWRGITSITPAPNASGSVYITLQNSDTDNNGVHLCTRQGNTGVSFSCERKLDMEFARDVAINPEFPSTLYATSSSAYVSGHYIAGTQGVMRSIDSGATWSQVNEGLAWPFANPVQIDPNDANKVYIGSAGGGFYKRSFAQENPEPASGGISIVAGNHPANVGKSVELPTFTALTPLELASASAESPSQTWSLAASSAGYYKIVNAGQGTFCLGNSSPDSTEPRAINCVDGNPNLEWKFEDQGTDSFLIRQRGSHLCLSDSTDAPYLNLDDSCSTTFSIPDISSAGGNDPLADVDGDGITNVLDNCSTLGNANQRDTNNDGIGNLCDPDLSNDNHVGFEDLSLLKAKVFNVDDDADFNEDGVVNFSDLARMKANWALPPG